MRDIRSDLRERLAAINGRHLDAMHQYDQDRDALEARHRETVAALERERSAVEQLLTIEEQKAGEMPSETRRLVPLVDFIVTKVHTHGPLDKEQLRSEATVAGYFTNGITARSLHVTLLNIAKNGRLVQLPDGRYTFPPRTQNALFGNESEH